jgi:hypothetical protein
MGLIYVAQITNYALAKYLPVIQIPKNTQKSGVFLPFTCWQRLTIFKATIH